MPYNYVLEKKLFEEFQIGIQRVESCVGYPLSVAYSRREVFE